MKPKNTYHFRESVEFDQPLGLGARQDFVRELNLATREIIQRYGGRVYSSAATFSPLGLLPSDEPEKIAEYLERTDE